MTETIPQMQQAMARVLGWRIVACDGQYHAYDPAGKYWRSASNESALRQAIAEQECRQWRVYQRNKATGVEELGVRLCGSREWALACIAEFAKGEPDKEFRIEEEEWGK